MRTETSSSGTVSPTGKLRPVNLRTDLAPLADLIELVFAPTMDDSGRAAIRDMRAMSRAGIGGVLLTRLNELAMGISMGFVWVEHGQLVGNVSLYPARWPRSAGDAWIIANVAVHPDYQHRGIARRLLDHSIKAIREKGSTDAILQVDSDNERAITIYERMGFIRERAFTSWGRSSLVNPPPPPETEAFITRRRPSEWQAEYALAQRVRPAERGGVGWLKPLDESLFRPSLWQQVVDWFTRGGLERMVARADSAPESELLASLWIETGLAALRIRMNLLVAPEHVQYGAALLETTLRRFRSSAFIVEHPEDDEVVDALLRRLRFRPHRTVWHMRLPLSPESSLYGTH